VNLRRAAEIQVVLEGIDLPASRDELVRYAAAYDPSAAAELERIPDREYERLDDVGEELVPTQPRRPREEKLPRPESGDVPGRTDYVRPHPESGEVRPAGPDRTPPQQVLEQQLKLQKRQQARRTRPPSI